MDPINLVYKPILLQAVSENTSQTANVNKIDQLPDELLTIIFFKVFEARDSGKGDLRVLALVSKKWKKLTESKQLQKSIAKALDACDLDEWKKHFGNAFSQADFGEVPSIPQWIGQNYKRQDLLTLIPKGLMGKLYPHPSPLQILNELQSLGILANSPTPSSSANTKQEPSEEMLGESIKIGQSRWVWMRKIEKELKVQSQRPEPNKAGTAAISGESDKQLSLLMNGIRKGQQILMWAEPIKRVDSLRNLLDMQEQRNEPFMLMGFKPNGPFVAIYFEEDIYFHNSFIHAQKLALE